MDILDIDEALKDDSFIFLEDKTHDDISNILQQWKSNSCLPTSITNTIQHPQPHQEQVNKLDSRTFTRPKRKSALSLESQFTNIAHQQQNGTVACESPMLNVEIGGLVTTMEKSFLQDTSPPSFLHSMDNSINIMNNSLITSADFTNISFLQSTNSLQDVEHQQHHIHVTGGGYTLNDMLRDRKTLESLTMSSDGTLIKDSHIGQIDDISLTLSKTASSCSTMENSTESEGGANRTVVMFNQNSTFNNSEDRGGIQLELAGAGAGDNITNNKTGHSMALTDEMIGDITYNLVENSMSASTARDATHPIIDNSCHELVNKTVSSIPQDGGLEGNTTFDYQQNVTPDKCCETPEAIEKNGTRTKICGSTPQASSLRYNKQPYTSRLHTIEDANISPITASSPQTPQQQQQLNNTYEKHYQVKNSTYISSNNTSVEKFPHQPVEIKENSSEGFNETYQQHYNTQTLGMQNVMHLAEAEANLLAANNNEEEFDHMLDEFGRIELNSEQLKMKKSLDSLKKRFNYNSNGGSNRPNSQPLDEDDVTIMKDNHNNREELRNSKERLNELSETSANEQILHKEQDSTFSSNSVDLKSSAVLLNGSTGLSLSAGSSGCGGERLLSRRSRLYDDINLSTITSTPASHNLRSSASFIIKKDNVSNNMGVAAIAANTAKCETECSNVKPLETEIDINNDDNICTPIQHKIMGKLLHDRDRFKTITISKNRTTKPRSEDVITNEFNVPCVEDCNVMESATNAAKKVADLKTAETPTQYYDVTEKLQHDRDRFKTITINNKRCMESKLNVPCIENGNSNEAVASDSYETPRTGRCSRRDQMHNTQLDATYDTETPTIPKTKANLNTNYLTYKKPKDLQTNVRNQEDTNVPIIPNKESKARPESRTLSRPRYINGLTKLSAVNKTTSADELEKALPNARNGRPFNTKESSSIGQSAAASIALKSPMGTKSKSFQNLSTNLTLNSGIAAPVQQLPCKTFGLHKPNSYGSGLVKPSVLRNSMLSATQQQKNDDSVFKVPKQVSGIRAPGGAGPLTATGTSIGKRAGLVRPSSGYYSLNVMAKGKQSQHTASDPESDSGRHSPTDSMSSASSKGSAQSLNKTFGLKPLLGSKMATTKANDVATNVNLQKVTIGSTGIPKPSGLRPPSNIKRSALPRPASFIKTDK